ncbi:MAG: hypothetical protein ABI835_04420 [Chloroflexota bacterium]
MVNEGVPDRRKGLVIGIVGGLVGAYAMRRYVRDLLPNWFPDASDPAQITDQPDPLERRAPFGQLYIPGENTYQAIGRVTYELTAHHPPPTLAQRQQLGDWAQWGMGLFAGIAYGATRTSTLPRDIAGGFFYGIRLWLGDEILLPLLGLRAGPTRFTKRQHFALLTSYWVYSFVTANLTRVLYRLFSPEDW